MQIQKNLTIERSIQDARNFYNASYAQEIVDINSTAFTIQYFFLLCSNVNLVIVKSCKSLFVSYFTTKYTCN